MRCEYCQKEYPVKDEQLVGQEIQCPHCGMIGICSRRRIMFICPECSKELEGELWMLGNYAECTCCGKNILLSRPENPGDAYSNSYLPANYQLGNYLIKKCITPGDSGEIYLARHVLLDRLCVLKLLRPVTDSGTVDTESLDRLVREARLISRICSPFMVNITDIQVDTKHNLSFIVTEYVQERNIENMLTEGALNEKFVLNAARCVSQALLAVSAHNVVHGNITPSNILVSDRGDVKLTAPDIARAGRKTGDLSGLTGTVAYAAPEQLSGSAETDCRTDIYSLGVTMYHMLSGHCPFEAPDTQTVVSMILRGEAKPLQTVAPQVSPECCRLISAMMSVQKENRPENAEKLLAMLDETLRMCSQSLFSRFFRGWKKYAAGAAGLFLLTNEVPSQTNVICLVLIYGATLSRSSWLSSFSELSVAFSVLWSPANEKSTS